MGMHTENLKVEGLFRVPGNQSRIQDLRERVDKTGGPIDLKNAQIHVRRTLGTRRDRKDGGREGGVCDPRKSYPRHNGAWRAALGGREGGVGASRPSRLAYCTAGFAPLTLCACLAFSLCLCLWVGGGTIASATGSARYRM
jgi:hypothetical protein